MEIERKFLIPVENLPNGLEQYAHKSYEQGYLCTAPVVRVRQEGDAYVLTYKGAGLLKREEHNLPLDKRSYQHLLEKADGTIINKTRYFIPLDELHQIELDIFHKDLDGLIMAEIEYPTEDDAMTYPIPDWFGREVTYDSAYHNSTMSQKGLPANLRE